METFLLFLSAHWEIIAAIIGNVIGWSKSVKKFFDWLFERRRAYYIRALTTCGWSDEYMCGTYFELKKRLQHIRDHIDGKLSGKDLVRFWSSGYSGNDSKTHIEYNYFYDCSNCLKYSFFLKMKLRKLNYVLLCNMTNNGIINDKHEIRALAVKCLEIIDAKISKYQLPENNIHCF